MRCSDGNVLVICLRASKANPSSVAGQQGVMVTIRIELGSLGTPKGVPLLLTDLVGICPCGLRGSVDILVVLIIPGGKLHHANSVIPEVGKRVAVYLADELL